MSDRKDYPLGPDIDRDLRDFLRDRQRPEIVLPISLEAGSASMVRDGTGNYRIRLNRGEREQYKINLENLDQDGNGVLSVKERDAIFKLLDSYGLNSDTVENLMSALTSSAPFSGELARSKAYEPKSDRKDNPLGPDIDRDLRDFLRDRQRPEIVLPISLEAGAAIMVRDGMGNYRIRLNRVDEDKFNMNLEGLDQDRNGVLDPKDRDAIVKLMNRCGLNSETVENLMSCLTNIVPFIGESVRSKANHREADPNLYSFGPDILRELQEIRRKVGLTPMDSSFNISDLGSLSPTQTSSTPNRDGQDRALI